jgi:hypothetical protein
MTQSITRKAIRMFLREAATGFRQGTALAVPFSVRKSTTALACPPWRAAKVGASSITGLWNCKNSRFWRSN